MVYTWYITRFQWLMMGPGDLVAGLSISKIVMFLLTDGSTIEIGQVR